jgi:5-methylcytosine-specific restriction endonuclease McrA
MAVNKKFRAKIFHLLNGHCYYCGEPLDFASFHIDHKNPLAYGGKNDEENLVPTCHYCNFSKKDRNVEQWRTLLENIKRRSMTIVRDFDLKFPEGKFYFEGIQQEDNK